VTLNASHSAQLKSWVEAANDPLCPFPIQNLPMAIFSTSANLRKRAGVAIGDQVLDLEVLERSGLLPTGLVPNGLSPTPTAVFNRSSLNAFMALGPAVWSAVRSTISGELSKATSDWRLFSQLLTPLADAQLHMPVRVTGYTDFYASREHATNVGTLFRGAENALMANWLHMPIAYNGRASTVVVSGTAIKRPRGQIISADKPTPVFTASRKLDMELEMAALVGTANPMGDPVSVAQAQEMIFGFVLLNDWSARDIQVWEYQPLGPFLGKAFATTISPWVISREALEPFRVDGPQQDPQPLSYLRQSAPHNYAIQLQAQLNGQTITETNFKDIYWSSAQQLAHHTSGGCAMQTGDLLGSGTISGSQPGSMGSLLELTWNGEKPLTLENGDIRRFLEDGDRLSLTGYAQGEGYRIGFGEAAATILPAPSETG